VGVAAAGLVAQTKVKGVAKLMLVVEEVGSANHKIGDIL